MSFGTLDGGLVMLIDFLFTQIPTYCLFQIFSLHAQLRRVMSSH